MNFSVYIIPVLVVALFIYAAIKKVPVFNAFIDGSKRAIPLLIDLLPYICAMLVTSALMEASGLNVFLFRVLSPVFSFLGIPEEIGPLVIIKPFSGTGSLSVLDSVFKLYGADSYIGRVASVVYGSGETIFYVSAVYYSAIGKKSPLSPPVICLVSSFFSVVFASFICHVL